jgi:probable O-glycosylation ligase (exosortase A-associated)
MRDIVLALVLAVVTPLSLIHPWIGVMNWTWLSLMSPHLMTYGFMYQAPVAMLAGGATLAGLVFSKDPKWLPKAPPLVWLAVFGSWILICYPFSLIDTSYNWGQIDKNFKIYLMTFVAVAVVSNRRQVDWLIGVCAFSIAFFGVKGGIFTLITGGGYRVRGDGGFIAGNNEIALALIMIVPLLYYFVQIAPRKSLRYALWGAIALSVVAVLGTQSRGGLIGVLGMALAFGARSQRRLRIVVPGILLAVAVAAFMPESWWERMATIKTYQEDESAMGRINAWTVAFNVAKDHFFGGGFYLEDESIFNLYAPRPEFIAVAHSIYFQVLGQLGFVGLFLYLAFWISTWRTCRWIAKNSQSAADQALARMVEISLVGFAVGGAFLNMAYFDGPYYLMAAMVVIRYKIMHNQSLSPAALSVKRQPEVPLPPPSTAAKPAPKNRS